MTEKKREGFNMNSEKEREQLIDHIKKIIDREEGWSPDRSRAIDTMISMAEHLNRVSNDFVGSLHKEIGEGLDKTGADADFRDHTLCILKYNIGCRLIGESFQMNSGVGSKQLEDLLRFILQIQEAVLEREMKEEENGS